MNTVFEVWTIMSLSLTGRRIASRPAVNLRYGSYPPEGMEAYPVSERVNSPTADDKRLIERVSMF
jgi:putative SOS response-associated peptidase YedK